MATSLQVPPRHVLLTDFITFRDADSLKQRYLLACANGWKVKNNLPEPCVVSKMVTRDLDTYDDLLSPNGWREFNGTFDYMHALDGEPAFTKKEDAIASIMSSLSSQVSNNNVLAMDQMSSLLAWCELNQDEEEKFMIKQEVLA